MGRLSWGEGTSVQKKLMERNIFLLLLILLALLVIAILWIRFHKQSLYDISGTYSSGSEPSDEISLVFQNGRFVIYNPEGVMEEGEFQKVEANGTKKVGWEDTDIYKLSSDTGVWKGYAIHKQNDIVLLNFMDAEVPLKKVSKTALYTYRR